MLLDIILVILLVLAAFKGFQRGLIVGIFSFIAIIVGLAAAMKMSALVADYLGESVRVSQTWLPIISFALVFIGVVLLIRLGANLLQKTVELSMMGWLNRVGGIILYASIYIIVYSIILFYAVQVNIVRESTMQESATYAFVQPWGPAAINALSYVVPWFRDMFHELEQFFEGVAHQVPPPEKAS